MKYFPCQLCLHSHHSCFVSVSQDCSQLYDLSRSERSKVHELAVTMATDGQPLERIGELLRVAVGPLDLSVKSVLRDAVERVVAALRYYISVCFISFYYRHSRKQKLWGGNIKSCQNTCTQNLPIDSVHNEKEKSGHAAEEVVFQHFEKIHFSLSCWEIHEKIYNTLMPVH